MLIEIEALFNQTTAFAWVRSGLGVNVFQAPTNKDKYPSDSRLVRFATGQPLGFFLASILVVPSLSCMADKVYPGRKLALMPFLLGDDIVIGDPKVALATKEVMAELGVDISLPKSLTSNSLGLEFAKKFRIHDRDFEPLENATRSSPRHSLDACLFFFRY